MLTAMCPESVLMVGQVRRFARRTRDFGRAYIVFQMGVDKGDAEIEGNVAIEKTRKPNKMHRNILDVDPGFIGRQ